jgi:hypothetical protein
MHQQMLLLKAQVIKTMGATTDNFSKINKNLTLAVVINVTSKLIYLTDHLLAVLRRLAQSDPGEVTPSPVSCQMLLHEPSCHTHPK